MRGLPSVSCPASSTAARLPGISVDQVPDYLGERGPRPCCSFDVQLNGLKVKQLGAADLHARDVAIAAHVAMVPDLESYALAACKFPAGCMMNPEGSGRSARRPWSRWPRGAEGLPGARGRGARGRGTGPVGAEGHGGAEGLPGARGRAGDRSKWARVKLRPARWPSVEVPVAGAAWSSPTSAGPVGAEGHGGAEGLPGAPRAGDLAEVDGGRHLGVVTLGPLTRGSRVPGGGKRSNAQKPKIKPGSSRFSRTRAPVHSPETAIRSVIGKLIRRTPGALLNPVRTLRLVRGCA